MGPLGQSPEGMRDDPSVPTEEDGVAPLAMTVGSTAATAGLPRIDSDGAVAVATWPERASDPFTPAPCDARGPTPK